MFQLKRQTFEFDIDLYLTLKGREREGKKKKKYIQIVNFDKNKKYIYKKRKKKLAVASFIVSSWGSLLLESCFRGSFMSLDFLPFTHSNHFFFNS